MNRFTWSMALRSLRYNLGQTFLTMGIVTISVTLIIGLSTMVQGMQTRIMAAVTDSMPHLTIVPEERLPQAAWQIPALQKPGALYVGKSFKLSQQKRKIEDWQEWNQRLVSFDPLVRAVAPVVSEQAILFRGAQPYAVRVTGVFPEEYNKVVEVQSKMIDGHFFGLTTGQIVLGAGVATDMSLQRGDKIRLISPEGTSVTFTVAGIFFSGIRQMDQTTVFIPLRDAQSIFGLATAISAIYVKIAAIYEAENLAIRLRHRAPFQINSWMEENRNLLSAMRSQSLTINIILLLTTIAAGFGIASILIMSVVSKLRELGILKAMGATRAQIIGVFTLQGFLISLVGACVGTGLGIGLARLLTSFRSRDAAGRFVSLFSVEIQYSIIVFAFAVALIVGLLAALYPAWRASRINPIDVIRGA